MLLKIQKLFNIISETTLGRICILWCPGHIDIKENEQVDALAKSAAENLELTILNFPLGLLSIKMKINQKFSFNKIKDCIIRNKIKKSSRVGIA